MWAGYTEGQLHRNRNSYEEGLLRLLVSMLPEGVKLVVPADRGFGRTELTRVCSDLGVRFLIRIKPDVRVTHAGYTGRLDDETTRSRGGCGGCRPTRNSAATGRWP